MKAVSPLAAWLLAILFVVLFIGLIFDTKMFGLAHREEAAIKARTDLQALQLIDNNSLCLDPGDDTTPAGGQNVWLSHVLKQDVAEDSIITPEADIGPRLQPNMHIVTVTIEKPAWELSSGDFVSLILVPADTTPASAATPFARVEDAVLIGLPWTDKSKVGDEGEVLIAIPSGTDAHLDLIAASAVVFPAGFVATPAPLPSTTSATPTPLKPCATPGVQAAED